MKKIVIVGAAFIVAIGGIVAFGVVNKSSKASTSNVIKIGGVFDTSGDASSYGKAEQDGANFAIKQINANGGVKVNGKSYKFKIINKDAKTDNTETASVTSSLINKEKVSAIVGPVITSGVQAAVPVATQGKIGRAHV